MAEIMRQWGTVIQAPLRVWMPGFQTYERAVGSRPSPSTSLNALVCTMKKSLWITVSLAGEFRGIWEPPTVKMKCVCVTTHVRMSMCGMRVVHICVFIRGKQAPSFPKILKVKVQCQSLQSCLTLATPWTAAHQAPQSIRFSGQEY